MKSNIFRSFINNISSIDNSQYVILKNKSLQIGNKDPIGLILETPIDELKCPYCDSNKKHDGVNVLDYRDIGVLCA